MLNKNIEIEVTLLSKEEIDGSKILKKIGVSCLEPYWIITPPYSNERKLVRELVVDSIGTFCDSTPDYGYGVRPVLKLNNLDKLINECEYEMKNGIQVVKYGYFPCMCEKLKISDSSFLRKTDNKYILPTQEAIPEEFLLTEYVKYDYNGQAVIKADGKYYPVKPIKFYVDRENNMLISTDVLFFSPIDLNFKHHKKEFETSRLYKYLNNEFIKGLTLNQSVKNSYSQKDISDIIQSADPNDIDELQNSLVKKIAKLLKRNAELQVLSKVIDSELEELKEVVKGKSYVKKI